VGTKSFEEVVEKVKEFTVQHDLTPIVRAPEMEGTLPLTNGLWQRLGPKRLEIKEYQINLNSTAFFPNTPVVLTRIDGHAALVNQKALDIAGSLPKQKSAAVMLK